MTKVNPAKEGFAEFAAQMARNPDSLAAFTEAMEDARRKRDIGNRIAEERERRGLTQPQVIERAGLGISANALRKYQYWEAGKHLPGHEQLEAIAEVLNVSYDYLITGGEQSPPAKDILARLDRIETQLARLGASGAPTDEPSLEEAERESIRQAEDEIAEKRKAG